MDFEVLVVKLIQCVLLMFNDNRFFPNQSSRVLKAIFNSYSVRLECDTKILVSSTNNIGKQICSIKQVLCQRISVSTCSPLQTNLHLKVHAAPYSFPALEAAPEVVL
jgi:hypothetical protein